MKTVTFLAGLTTLLPLMLISATSSALALTDQATARPGMISEATTFLSANYVVAQTKTADDKPESSKPESDKPKSSKPKGKEKEKEEEEEELGEDDC